MSDLWVITFEIFFTLICFVPSENSNVILQVKQNKKPYFKNIYFKYLKSITSFIPFHYGPK